MAGTVESKYTIKQSGTRRPSFKLEQNGRTVGELKFHNERGSKAVADIGSQQLHFYRQRGLKKDVGIHSHPSSLIGSFSADLLSRGNLAFANHTYRWAPANSTQTTWAWYDESGNEILSIHKTFHLYKENGEITEFRNALNREDAKTLSLLGWYLILLGQQDILQHLFVSLETTMTKPIKV